MKTNDILLILGAVALYELIAWKVNGQRVGQSLTTTGITPSLLPFDLIGQIFGYPPAANSTAPPPSGQTSLPPLFPDFGVTGTGW